MSAYYNRFRNLLFRYFLVTGVFVFSIGISNGKAGAGVSILAPSDYVVANLQEGDTYYLDRDYILISVPYELSGGGEEWIMTKNNDKTNSSASFLQFTISQDATVYVAYDSRATSLPNWLRAPNFTPTSLEIEVDEDPYGSLLLNVYERVYPAGAVVLGGNLAAGASGARSNYIVVVKSETTEICDNGLDDDSDGLIDCDDPDCNGDIACLTCTDADSDGYYTQSGCETEVDCNDSDPNINPGAMEICSGNIDNDCDGLVDCSDSDCAGDPACANNVTIIAPDDYVVGNLQEGDEYYLDRDYTLESIPPELSVGGEEWIKTKNNDKTNSSESFLQFSVLRASTVYVAYDSRATSLPNWLGNSFDLTSLSIDVIEGVYGSLLLNIYKRIYPAGTVVLGGNRAAGASGTGSNYIVVVQPSASEICDNGLDDDLDGLTDCNDSDCSGDPSCGPGTVIFSDDFDDGNADGWIIVNDGGAFSSWQVANGEYFQQTTMNNPVGFYQQAGSIATSYHIGAFSYLDGWEYLSDYRFRVKVIPMNGTEYVYNGWDVGVHFRHQDSNNYYRISFNSLYGYTRFEKKVNGVFSTLGVNARGYKKGEVLDISIEVVLDNILIYLNNAPVFSAIDDSLLSGTVALYCGGPARFDDVVIEQNSPSPSMIVSKPNAHSIEISDTLNVSAVPLNIPDSRRAEFRLYQDQGLLDQIVADESQSSLGSVYFTGEFGGLSQGEYRIDAVLIDTDGGDEVVATDINTTIGVLGGYHLTIGDSIFNGIGDFFSLDNISSDERVVSFQGHHSVLNDLLIATSGYPHIVFNEAVPGDETVDTLDRIHSIVERHRDSDLGTKANGVFILLGTNDSGDPPVDSGLGCIPGIDCAGTYKGNMLDLIGFLETDGISDQNVTVALIPPVFAACPDCPPFLDLENAPRNLLIQQYNEVIKNPAELHEVYPNITIGPDLFSFFKDRYSLFAERLHPNALGNVMIAYLLNGDTLPFFLENLVPSAPSDYPSTYKQTLLEEGNTYYIDRDYTLTNIPTDLKNGIFLMTANNDKSITSENHITFSVDRACTVYVAYDSRASSLPNWIGSFQNTGLTIGTTDITLNVFSKAYSAGPVQLGGNHAPGATGAGSNYIAIVVEN